MEFLEYLLEEPHPYVFTSKHCDANADMKKTNEKLGHVVHTIAADENTRALEENLWVNQEQAQLPRAYFVLLLLLWYLEYFPDKICRYKSPSSDWEIDVKTSLRNINRPTVLRNFKLPEELCFVFQMWQC